MQKTVLQLGEIGLEAASLRPCSLQLGKIGLTPSTRLRLEPRRRSFGPPMPSILSEKSYALESA
ncbi:hypothetical protein [Paenibacillus aestuarii]|uniref:Uncharacterized protein n=1 Tax=Paenibacillus aestuarii TaxID=516965 RepID=A0ABW0KCR6_9BACL|nr:hypothetical protein [Paenibacillus aestuarii]